VSARRHYAGITLHVKPFLGTLQSLAVGGRLGAHLDMANDERAIASILIDLALRPCVPRRRTVEP
jgi:hypothetical protein